MFEIFESRLIKLLKQRDNGKGLSGDEYEELYKLIKEEHEQIKETISFYRSLEDKGNNF